MRQGQQDVEESLGVKGGATRGTEERREKKT